MKNLFTAASLLAISASGALAGGLDRSGQSIALIFEEGSAVNLSFGLVDPTVSSSPDALAGDVGESYSQIGFGYKTTYSNGLDVALIYDQPFGANVAYGTGGLAGTEAKVTSGAFTALASKDLSNSMSVHGGVRIQAMTGTAGVLPTIAYTLETERSTGFGYLVGAAYERPDIALRVSLTYNSAIDHTFSATEASVFGPSADPFEITTPQSVNLEFQSGIAADTLLFGSVRWVDWSEFDITPANYPGGSLVDYDNDVMTYNLGIGRRFTDTFSGAITFGYEEATGEPASNLGPTDGYFSVSLGGTYTMDDTKITAGVRWVDIGDTTTTASIPFADNSATALGVSITRSF